MKRSMRRNTTKISPTEELKKAHHEIKNLKLENAKLRRIIYGARSEKIKAEQENSNQLALFERPVEIEEEPSEEPKPKKKQKRPGRKPMPEHFEEEVVFVKAPLSETFDKHGNKLSLLGHEISKRLKFIPATFIIVVTKREKWGHKDSRQLVFTAPPPKNIVPKGKYSDSFIHFVIFQKFFMSLPLYRQIQDYGSSNLEISKSVL
jgi:transposase